jgi:hypothetical protein
MSSRTSLSATAAPPATFNLAVPALPGALFSYFNEDLDSSVSWSPHPDLIAGIRTRLVDAVGKLPRRYLLPPINGELFESIGEADERLLGYSLAAGFQVVGGSGGKTGAKKVFFCIHHGKKTQNNRKLEERVERDPNDKKVIVSNRKRDDTHQWVKNCL